MIKLIEGDLLVNSVGAQAIGHGCNRQVAMGAGVAGQIARKWPQVFQAYARAIREDNPEIGSIIAVGAEPGLIVLNMLTQNYTGPFARYDAVDDAMYNAVVWANLGYIKSLAIPMIGAGIGGLEEAEVMKIFMKYGQGWKGTLYVYTKYVAGK